MVTRPIGLHGKKRAGKDTVAQHLLKFEIFKHYEVKKFAGTLKQMCSVVTRQPIEVFTDGDLYDTIVTWPNKYTMDDALPEILRLISFDEKIWGMNFMELAYRIEPVLFGIRDALRCGDYTSRRLQQELGTDFFRNRIDNDFWIKCLGSMDNTIISDMRFPNEYTAIKEAGGFLVKIVGGHQNDPMSHDDHPSETALDHVEEWDFVINNDESVTKLQMEARRLALTIRQEE